MARSLSPSHTLMTVAGACLLSVAMLYAASGPDKSSANPGEPASSTPKKFEPVANYDEQIKKDYVTRFGANPFLPSQAKSESGGFIQPGAFPTAEYCGKCHEDAHKQWRESAHANSFRAPFYLKNVNLLIDGKGIEFSRHCEGCHNPIALFSGALTKGSKVDRVAFDNDGVTCSICHSIIKVQNTSGTGSYVMGTPAVMVKADGTRIPGQVNPDEILANPELHSKAVMQEFYKSPEFCAVCHKAALPRQINDYKWLRAFSVYDEWQQSSWARENPLPFYRKDAVSTCQTCHMKPVDAPNDYGAVNGKIASHRWLGANTAIPKYYGFDIQLEQTIQFLQDDNLGIDLFAATDNDNHREIAPLGRTALDLRAGESVTLAVVIQNKKIGHSLVPEQRDFYESWVEFEVRDSAGKTLTHSGYFEPNGDVESGAHSYTNRLISKDGKWLDRHEVWETHNKPYDNTIMPGSSDLVRYQFTVPKDVEFPLSVTTKVNYRRFRQAFTNFVLGMPAQTYPTVVMGSKTVQLQLANPASNEPDKNEWMRWNNYGIALLNQSQYAQAIAAFEHVVELRPDYPDAYTNVALANFRNEKYDAAMESLNKALALAPGDARAVFYRASILRQQGNMEEAEALFQSVLKKYPRMRDAHRELGYTYYQQHKYVEAREQYELVQTIDPDDLSAHYNLMLIYRRLGQKDKAAEQAALFSDRKDDPASNSLSLEFLRQHPEISAENVPWHVHPESHEGAAVAQK